MGCGARTAGFDHLAAQPLGHGNVVGRVPGVEAANPYPLHIRPHSDALG